MSEFNLVTDENCVFVHHQKTLSLQAKLCSLEQVHVPPARSVMTRLLSIINILDLSRVSGHRAQAVKILAPSPNQEVG